LFALAGLATISAGRIVWGNTELTALGEERRAAFRRQNIGLVFQDFLLFEELTALANASLAGAYAGAARKTEIDRRAGEALDRLGLGPVAHRRVDSFSGGERQRVSVARALASYPPVILADEPTASLDRAAADALVEDLVRLVRDQGKTLIAVSHDHAVHDRMDRIIEIADGQFAGEGNGRA
jgi:putative ABC transport system ATP-binding protein